MKKFFLIIISISILFNNFIFLNLQSQINNIIIVKVGESLITSLDVENEIITNLIIKNQEINQASVNNNKKYAVKNLINKSIKKSEINKYEIKDYNEQDLKNYVQNIAKELNTDSKGLKNIFKQSNIDYEVFLENYKIELLWNTLIFQYYKNQTNINTVDLENEIEKVKDNKTEEEVKKIRKNFLEKKKQEKLNLFSRSHFANLENTIVIDFQ
tara:strand:+ start:219 stop:857 length:639 start_codon:yes stop_codon:yes gene_type:complete